MKHTSIVSFQDWKLLLTYTSVHERSKYRQVESHMACMQDPQIFTDCIKPHFEYHSPPLQRFDRKDSASGRQSLRPKIRPQRYAYVEPVSAFKDALSAAGKAMGAAGKAVGAAGMAVLNFGSNQNGSEPSTSRQEEWGGSPSSSKVPSSSRRNSSQLKPVVNPEKEEEKPETDVLKTYGVPEFVPDF